MRTLWRGVASVVLGAGPAHAVYFATYEQTKKLLTMGGQQPSALAAGAAGGAATVVSDALMNPFDVVKQRMQLANSAHRSIL
ncbi:Fe(2+) transporter, partial [Coemansia spiralis]